MLAIIIPFYKISYFDKTVASLLSQTNKNFTVYIGNDASPDDPTSIIKQLDGIINYRYKRFSDNMGSTSLVAQWNRCIAMMEDEPWFMILGDDDYLSEDFVESFYQSLTVADKHHINVIKSAQKWVDEDNQSINEKTQYPEISDAAQHFEDKYLGRSRMSLSELIFRKEAFDKTGFINLPMAWWSDVLAFLDVSSFGKVFFMQQSTVYVRISAESISGSESNMAEKRMVQVQFLAAVLERHGARLSRSLYSTLFTDFIYYNKLLKTNLKLKKIYPTKMKAGALLKYLISKN